MKALRCLVAVGVLGLVAGAVVVWTGLYDISATDQHLPPTYAVLQVAKDRSVARRAKAIAVPALDTPGQLERGLALFHAHCVQCHGGPGVPPEPFALALRPLPTPLVRSGRDRPPEYLYWVLSQGIKMTAMPAWEFRLPERDLWAVVAALKALPFIAPREYRPRALPAVAPAADDESVPIDPERGKRALEQYACVGCHEVPGVIGPETRVGPPLTGVGSRRIIAGVLDNTPENLVRWIRAPAEVAPGTAMPNLGVRPRDARDMAAYLATLR